ncbi:acetyl-CoA carboxylase, biotin carboxyl carrier protein [Aurantiacibacter xanthus]|uniref:Biotin carboxyl carrier protein of acetyl-CoA carboxylase n=1 Tax=Aurantiacibacter xanthus TaxID=1784712 RepID=A0A3A1P7T3_9SPHN|nr:biotin/lipoyl-containing protein [Aurantiacibacter xanthus]RIV84770.1 acetyl-CoA carboxylase, biotin carboxyl carrier protein [Aurantiacibacter xanthus]
MSLTGKDIVEIARLLDASHFTTLDLTQGDFRLRISRDGAGGWREEEADQEPEETSRAEVPPPPQPAAARAGGVEIPAPLIGNFYSAPRPGEPDFVQVGDRVSKDTVVAIVEVMKLMNSVAAGVEGVVTAVLAENGSAVAEGQALFRVKVD